MNGLGQSDLCADPVNAGTDYCRLREPGESVAAFNERRLAELERADSLEVRIREGVEQAAASVPAWAWVSFGILAAFVAADTIRGRR